MLPCRMFSGPFAVPWNRLVKSDEPAGVVTAAGGGAAVAAGRAVAVFAAGVVGAAA
jgi:hypothetical protein